MKNFLKLLKELEKRVYLPSLFVFLLGLLLSTGAALVLHQKEKAFIRSEFERQVNTYTEIMQGEMNRDLEVLESIGSFFEASELVSRREYTAFTQGRIAFHKDIQALEWVPGVKSEERPLYEKMARLDGFPGFRFTQRKDDGTMIPRSWAKKYYPVYFLEPFKGNEKALGFDLNTDPDRKAAMEQARDSGNMATTVPLLRSPEEDVDFLIFRPVYAIDPPATVEEKRKRLKGFALGVYSVEGFVHESLEKTLQPGIELTILDPAAPPDRQRLYRYPENKAGEIRLLPLLSQGRQVDLPGRSLTVSYAATAQFTDQYRTNSPWLAFLGGLLFTGLLSLYLLELNARRQKLEELSQNLNQAQAISHLGSWEWDFAADNVACSEETCRILGIPYIDQPISFERFISFIHPDEKDLVKSVLNAAINEGKPFSLDHQILGPGGIIRHVHNQSEITRYEGGRPALMTGTLQDITERKALEREIMEGRLERERLKTMQALSATYAHNILNAVTPMKGYAELLQKKTDPSDPRYEWCQKIIESTEAVTDIVTKIKELETYNTTTFGGVEIVEIEKKGEPSE